MAGSETILLVMADAARRSRLFAALADRPQRIVRSFGCARDAAAALDSCDAGCIVIDVAGLSGGSAALLLRAVAAAPSLVTLAIADRLDADDALALIHAHPADIVPQSIGDSALAQRITRLMPTVQRHAALWRDRTSAEHALARLSPREASVIAALARGATSKDIARSLGVSPRTVEVHRASIMRRTNCATLAELLRLYFLVQLGAPTNSSIAA